jgi:hypothetical protein
MINIIIRAYNSKNIHLGRICLVLAEVVLYIFRNYWYDEEFKRLRITSLNNDANPSRPYEFVMFRASIFDKFQFRVHSHILPYLLTVLVL